MDARGQGLTDAWSALAGIFDSARNVVLASHIFPDGDSIGSEVALALHLSARGKSVVVLNETPAPDRYAFLTRFHPISSRAERRLPRQTDVVVCLDVSSWDYMGRLGDEIRASGATIVSVDHHHLRSPFGHLDVNCESAASTGEVLYRYFRAMGAEVTPPMAEAVYASILFDTCGLRLGNTNNETIRIAAELVELGVDHRRLCVELFENDSWNKMNLWRLALGALRLECDGRLAWLAIPEDLFSLTSTHFADGDGILDSLLALRDLEVAILFREVGDGGGIKATFRSKGQVDVSSLAEALGGGGRTTAAGVVLVDTLHGAIERVVPRVHGLLARTPGETPAVVAGRRSRRVGASVTARIAAALGS